MLKLCIIIIIIIISNVIIFSFLNLKITYKIKIKYRKNIIKHNDSLKNYSSHILILESYILFDI